MAGPRAERHHSPGSKDVKGWEASCATEGCAHLFVLKRDNRKISRLGLEFDTAAKYIAGGGNFLPDTKLKSETLHETMLSKPNSFVPSLPPHCQIRRTRHIKRPAPLKVFSHGHSKPLAFGSCEGCDLTALPAVLFPAANPANSGRVTCSVEACRNRPRVNNQTCGLFTMSAYPKNVSAQLHSGCLHGAPAQTYVDPARWAPASFVHRLSEISSLEVETVRQEKVQKLRRIRRQEW